MTTATEKTNLGIQALYDLLSGPPYNTHKSWSRRRKFVADPVYNAELDRGFVVDPVYLEAAKKLEAEPIFNMPKSKFTLDPLYNGQVGYDFVLDPLYVEPEE
jgi:hypothetical protein